LCLSIYSINQFKKINKFINQKKIIITIKLNKNLKKLFILKIKKINFKILYYHWINDIKFTHCNAEIAIIHAIDNHININVQLTIFHCYFWYSISNNTDHISSIYDLNLL